MIHQALLVGTWRQEIREEEKEETVLPFRIHLPNNNNNNNNSNNEGRLPL